MPKSETFDYFTKITAATWTFNKNVCLYRPGWIHTTTECRWISGDMITRVKYMYVFFFSPSKMWGTLTIIDYNPIILRKMAVGILCHVIWDPLHHAECGSKTNVKATLCIPNFATTCYSHQNCRLHTCMCTLKHLKTLGLT